MQQNCIRDIGVRFSQSAGLERSAKKWTSTERGLELMTMHPDDLSQSQYLPEGKGSWCFIEPVCALPLDFQQANSRVQQ